jgi:hypothetical protein
MSYFMEHTPNWGMISSRSYQQEGSNAEPKCRVFGVPYERIKVVECYNIKHNRTNGAHR